jgi:ABC-type multidrug transport system ATPase subunit
VETRTGGSHTVVLSAHTLPEVSQTGQHVVIIYKGRVVAVHIPENLTARGEGRAGQDARAASAASAASV